MPVQKGRDLLLKIGNGANPEVFTTLGACRAVAVTLSNGLADATGTGSAGFQEWQAAAGMQSMEAELEGLFRDAAAEEAFRLSAFARTAKNYQLIFPNGDLFAGAFVIRGYRRSGTFDGLEAFSAVLARTGAGTFTPGG